MHTCVIAADMLNEGYQSMGGAERKSEGSDGKITGKKRV